MTKQDREFKFDTNRIIEGVSKRAPIRGKNGKSLLERKMENAEYKKRHEKQYELFKREVQRLDADEVSATQDFRRTSKDHVTKNTKNDDDVEGRFV